MCGEVRCGRACEISFAGVRERSSEMDSTTAGSNDRELRFEGYVDGFDVTVLASRASHCDSEDD
jgi:hypothetical protein